MPLPYQNKLKRLVYEPESTPGTFKTFDTSSYVIPCYDITLDRARGTQTISRADVFDGYGGEMCGVPGTFGTNLSFTTEIHDEDVPYPYWANLLTMCGFSGSVAGAVTTLEPTDNQIVGSTGNGENGAGSFGLFQFVNGQNDYAMYSTGTTGAATLSLTNERLSINFAMVGLNDGGAIDATQESLASVAGDVTFGCTPFVGKGISITFTDSQAAPIDAVNVASIEISTNVNVAESIGIEAAQGFNVSPVFWDEAPTVTIEMASTEDNNAALWARYFGGQTIKLEATYTNPATGHDLKIVIDKLQLITPSKGDTNGYESDSLEFKVVREPGSSYRDTGSKFSIIWDRS